MPRLQRQCDRDATSLKEVKQHNPSYLYQSKDGPILNDFSFSIFRVQRYCGPTGESDEGQSGLPWSRVFYVGAAVQGGYERQWRRP